MWFTNIGVLKLVVRISQFIAITGELRLIEAKVESEPIIGTQMCRHTEENQNIVVGSNLKSFLFENHNMSREQPW
jgi:hypothetical protein